MDQLDQSWRLDNADLLQQKSIQITELKQVEAEIVMLRWLQGNDSSKKQYENLTQMRVGYELWQRFSGQSDVDALRNQTIISISKYVKDNPKVSKEQLAKEIGRQIQEFADKVEKL